MSTTETTVAAPPVNLFTLPPELRDLIYAYVLPETDRVITMLDNFSRYREDLDARPPGLCLASRQLRSETLPLFYSTNTFTAQLDNAYDLHTAVAWLTAIGEANVGHLRRLVLRGWTRIPFGHMISKRYVEMRFDLREGSMEIESKDGACASALQHPLVVSTAGDLKEVFEELVKARGGRRFDVESVERLMEGFNGLCIGY